MSAEHPLHDLAMAIRYDLTSAQGKLTELMRQIGEYDLPVPTKLVCPECGIERSSETILAEHLYQLHDGPVPAHWKRVEGLSA